MGVSKVIYGDNPLIDLTSDTVSANNLLQGETAHGANGDLITGAVITHDVIDNLTTESSNDALSAKQGKILNQIKLDKDGVAAGYTRTYGIDPDGNQITIPAKYGSYDEIRKHEDYLYEVNYSNLDYDNAYEYFNSRKIPLNTGACSVLKKGNLIGRNFDWTYDENVSFIVHTAGNENRYASIGMSGGATNLTKTIVEGGEFNDAYKIVPFLLVDGVNECGVFIEENVVPQDYERTTGTTPAVELKESLCSLMIVRFVLDHFATAQSAVEYLRDYTSIYSPKGLDDMHYDVHFFISDKNNTYVIEFIENEIQIIDLTNKNKIMTNFHLYNTTMDSNGKVIINRDGSGTNSSGVTANGSGLERYNLIIDNYDDIEDADDMRDVTNILKYTNAYNLMYPNFWYTEFTGINGLDVTSPASDYTTIIKDTAEKYSHRSRNKESEYFGTWQTTHSAVYDLDNYILRLLVQEGNNEFSFPIVHKEIITDNYYDLKNKPLYFYNTDIIWQNCNKGSHYDNEFDSYIDFDYSLYYNGLKCKIDGIEYFFENEYYERDPNSEENKIVSIVWYNGDLDGDYDKVVYNYITKKSFRLYSTIHDFSNPSTFEIWDYNYVSPVVNKDYEKLFIYSNLREIPVRYYHENEDVECNLISENKYEIPAGFIRTDKIIATTINGNWYSLDSYGIDSWKTNDFYDETVNLIIIKDNDTECFQLTYSGGLVESFYVNCESSSYEYDINPDYQDFFDNLGSSDYEDLSNQPQINGITLIGNKSLDDLGIQETWGNIVGNIGDQEDLQNILNGKQDNLPTIVMIDTFIQILLLAILNGLK